LSTKDFSFLKEAVLKNIKAFQVSDFCPEGGWPKFDDLEVLVFGQFVDGVTTTYDVELLYACEAAACCFIPGSDVHSRLRKKIKIGKTSFEVLP